MRVLLFGATGDIGRHVREIALAAGHELVLFARHPSRLEPLHEGETSFRGDIGEPARVREALVGRGVDAVVSALGPTANTPDQVALFTQFARTLVAAMKDGGVRRLVTLSGGAVTVPGERKGIADRIAGALVRRAVPYVVDAKQRELDVVAASDLDWVAPRPPRVVPGPVTGKYRAGKVRLGPRSRITEGDLAHFMVAQLTDDTYLGEAPTIAS